MAGSGVQTVADAASAAAHTIDVVELIDMCKTYKLFDKLLTARHVLRIFCQVCPVPSSMLRTRRPAPRLCTQRSTAMAGKGLDVA